MNLGGRQIIPLLTEGMNQLAEPLSLFRSQ